MMVTRVALRASVVASAVAVASGVNVLCPPGRKVFSLTVWSGEWVDGFYMICTGGGEEKTIPEEFNENPGGDNYDGICAGTGGVRSLEWDIPSAFDNRVMVYGNITCQNDETVFFADSAPYDQLVVKESRSVSCEEGEHVYGLKYDITHPVDSDFPYFLTSVGFMCSAAPLDPICTVCSGDRKLLSDEDKPDDCASSICTEAECCESIEQHPGLQGAAITVISELVVMFVGWIATRACGLAPKIHFVRLERNGEVEDGDGAAGESGAHQRFLPDGNRSSDHGNDARKTEAAGADGDAGEGGAPQRDLPDDNRSSDHGNDAGGEEAEYKKGDGETKDHPQGIEMSALGGTFRHQRQTG